MTFDDYADLFQDFLSADFSTASDKTAKPTEEERRIAILVQALREQKGLRWVSEKLRSEKLRKLYVRNPIEFVLEHCFLCNDTDGAYQKYDQKAFMTLWKALKYDDAASVDLAIRKEQIGKTKSVVTFGSLREFVSNSSDGESASVGNTKTAQITLEIANRMQTLDVTQADAGEKFNRIFQEYARTFKDSAQSVRFYFAKYVYYLICHQVLELKELLLQFSSTAPKDVLESIRKKSGGDYRWSLLAGLRRDNEMDQQIIKKQIDAPSSDAKQLSKELLRAVRNNFVLMGAASSGDGFPLLSTGEQLCMLTNKTSVFAEATDAVKHAEYRRIIENMQISDFYGYAIDFSKLYHLLFELLISKKETWFDEENTQSENGKNFIKGVLDGKYDMSRSAVLMYLASVRGALFNVERFMEEYNLVFGRDSVLDLTRVNKMLKRMGYVNLGDNVGSKAESEVDKLYSKVFSTSSEDPIALDALSDEIADFVDEYGYSPIPFEVADISAKERRKRILREVKSVGSRKG